VQLLDQLAFHDLVFLVLQLYDISQFFPGSRLGGVVVE
jgi:hypothetical protein